MFFKNVTGQKLVVFAFDETDNSAVTGDSANITCKVSIDGAAATSLTDTNPAELENGYYVFDLAASEVNGNMLTFIADSSTSNVQVVARPDVAFTTVAKTSEVQAVITAMSTPSTFL